MTAAYNPHRLGNVYDASGASLSTSYAFGSTFYADRGGVLVLEPFITPDPGGTGLTGVTVKLQGRATDTAPWQDLQTIDLDTGNQQVEQAYTPTIGSTPVPLGPLEADPRGFVGGFQIGVKVTRSSTKGADEVTVQATAG